MRWVVGDVHGCIRTLEELVRRMRFDPARDELWAIGDLVNTGSGSLETLRLWRDLGARGVIGNHDVYALLARSGRWPRKGDQLDALFAAPDADELLALLRRLPVLARLRGNGAVRDVWLVHAGLHPRWGELETHAAEMNAGPYDDDRLERADLHFATRARCVSAGGDRSKHVGPPETCPAPYRPWDAFYGGPVLVVHGHWAYRGFYRNRHTLGLDSGCVYGLALTAWTPDEDRVVQVPSRD